MNDIQSTIPDIFCWTRFGTEAAEPIEHILERKERERRWTSGVFYWGVGNSVASSIAELVRRRDRPAVLFSPIKSRPRPIDVSPPALVMWQVAETPDGERFDLPTSVLVTSRGRAATARPHYALVCSSEYPLVLGDVGRLSIGALRNLLSGRPVGASQVTAVVKYDGDVSLRGHQYRVSIRAALVPPYFVRLHEPIAIRGTHLGAEPVQKPGLTPSDDQSDGCAP